MTVQYRLNRVNLRDVVMSDLQHLQYAAEHWLAQTPAGRQAKYRNLYAYVTRGWRGILLPSIHLPAGYYTTLEACRWFLERTKHYSGDMPLDCTDEELAAYGL